MPAGSPEGRLSKEGDWIKPGQTKCGNLHCTICYPNRFMDSLTKSISPPFVVANLPNDANPKDLLGVKKVPLNLLPAAGRIWGAKAMQDGARKYGPYNWRDKKIIASIYLDAIERHLLAFVDGEDLAEDSKVHHLGHIIADASILLDAIEGGFLIDDRPKAGPAAYLLKKLKET